MSNVLDFDKIERRAKRTALIRNIVVYGLLGEVFPLYLVFVAGTAISLAPMLWISFHPETKRFILEH